MIIIYYIYNKYLFNEIYQVESIFEANSDKYTVSHIVILFNLSSFIGNKSKIN